jgi:hypothetical protein
LWQSKNELGWADFRLTEYAHIQKWWELVSSAYLIVSLHSSALQTVKTPLSDTTPHRAGFLFAEHPHWDDNKGWKNLLNNLRLIIQPFIGFNLQRALVRSISNSAVRSRLYSINFFYESILGRYSLYPRDW